MLEFKLKATGSDLSFDELTVALDGTIAADSLNDMLGELVLKSGSDELASESSFSTSADDENVTFDLDDTFTIDEGDTETFRVYATINDIDNFTQGDDLKVSFAKTGIAAEDENGDEVTNETGSATGETQSFYTKGISVDVKSATTTITSVDGATNDTAEFNWVIDVTAFGDDDVYVNGTIANILATQADATLDTVYKIERSAGAALTAVGGTITESDSDVSEVTGVANASGTDYYAGDTFFKIDAGQTGTFTINLTGTNQIDAKQVRAMLSALEWTTDVVDDATVSTETINSFSAGLEDDSVTPYKLIN